MMYKYFLGLGSNIEPRINFIKRAVTKLKKVGLVKNKSGIYKTQAWGLKDQPDFINAVIEFHSDCNPEELLHKIKKVESEVGRSESYRWGPREIDIDILFCDNLAINKPNLTIPHKDFEKRKFILEPLSEICKNYKNNGTIKKVTDCIANCQDDSEVKKLKLSW